MKRYVLCLIPVFILLGFVLSGCGNKTAEYETKLFDTSYVHEIDITLVDEDWNDLLENPTEKTKYKADIVIDGEELKNVAFATKGNSSLFFVADDPDSDRYSFKVRFGKYEEEQTYYGLDKLNLNNNYCDATYMKDHISYGMFRKAGVPAPLTSYVWLKVNGKDRGLYLAVEDMGEGLLDRVYDGEGAIYKPEPQGIALTLDETKKIKKYGLTATEDPHGADLIYTDDDPASYPDIIDNAETETEDADTQNVIGALKGLSEAKDLERYLDTSEIIKFFAAHNFVLNYDSYTGSMLHNLALYENKGKLALLPWDYNLAFGAFKPVTGEGFLKDPTDLVNRGIDSPLIGTTETGRPMWKWIALDAKYRSEYHEALDKLIAEYIESGQLDKEIRDLHEMLLPYVQKDPTAFYTADEFTKGCETLRQFCDRRAQSIRKQLQGELSTLSKNQSDLSKVDASDLDASDMGVADM